MKTIIRITVLSIIVFPLLCLNAESHAGDNDEAQIKKTIKLFTEGADKRNIDDIDKALHQDFRVVFTDLEKLQTMFVNKSTYLDNIKTEKWGGSSRALTIENIDVIDKGNALAKVTLKGEKMTFISHYTFVKNAEKGWQIVQDLPHVIVH